jgi:hypothetical protein
MILLKKHRNMLFDCVCKAGLPIQRFAALDVPRVSKTTHDIFEVSLVGSPLVFQVWSQDDLFRFIYRYRELRKGFPFGKENGNKTEAMLLIGFRKWLDTIVKVYIQSEDIPDLWHLLEDYRRFVNPSGSVNQSDYEYFTEQEKAQVREALIGFRHLLIAEYKPTPEQISYIDERLDYLAKGVDRLNRFDWRGLALSTVISIGINLAVDTETGRRLLEMFQQAFMHGLRLLGAG